MKERAEDAVQRVADAGADDAVVKINRSRDRQVRFSRNDVDVVKTWSEEEIDVFAAVDGRVVTTTVTDPDRFDGAVDRLMATAEAADPNPAYTGIADGPFDPTIRRPDAAIRDVDAGKLVHAAIGGATDEGADTAAGTLFVRDHRVALATTGGCVAEEPWRGLELSVRAFDGDGTGHAVRCATQLDDLEPAEIGARAARFAGMAGDTEAGEPGSYRVLFEPMFLATLLDNLAGMTSAYAVQAGLSVYGPDDLGSSVASDAVTLKDDPSRRDALGHRAFDDEGRTTREVATIRGGVLETFLHNTSTAAAFDAEPTASAGLVAPGPSQIVLEPGDASRDRLLEELGDGLWLTNAWYTRYQNRTTGAFSTLPRDAQLVVEDGEVVGAVDGLRLSDNLRELFERVELVGSDVEQIKWWAETGTPTFAPPAVVDDVTFTTSWDA